jgi:membrane protein DedA with SNARE-associated domain
VNRSFSPSTRDFGLCAEQLQSLEESPQRTIEASLQAIDQILSLIGQYGYLVVFFGVMLESTGIPLPGETILIAAGFLVHQGSLNPGVTLISGILGTIIGNQIGYWVGHRGGRLFVLHRGRYVGITPERLVRAQEFFDCHGGKAVFLARFVPGLRAFAALVAGTSCMHRRTFFFYNVLAGTVWATASVLIGYLFGGSLDLVEEWIGLSGSLLVLLLVLALVFYLAYRWVAEKSPPR